MELEECMRTVHMADPLSESSLVEKHSVWEARTVAPSVYRPQSWRPSAVTNHTHVIGHRGCEGAGGRLRDMEIANPSVEDEERHLWPT